MVENFQSFRNFELLSKKDAFQKAFFTHASIVGYGRYVTAHTTKNMVLPQGFETYRFLSQKFCFVVCRAFGDEIRILWKTSLMIRLAVPYTDEQQKRPKLMRKLAKVEPLNFILTCSRSIEELHFR